jgi:molybdate transport system substrate-binding protein
MNGILALLLATIHVSAAASLQDVMRDVAAHYRRDTLLFNFAGSDLLARQIMLGAPADVFISADEARMNAVERVGLVEPGTRRDLVSNSLVIAVPSDSTLKIRAPRDLAAAAVQKIAIGQPDSVPAGIYAKQYLKDAGVWDLLAAKIVPVGNVRAALAAVASGDVDAAIIYKTDALIVTSVRVAYEVPRKHGPKILYPAAVISNSSDKIAAKRLVDYLTSAEGRAVFKRHGFVVP